MKVFIDGKYYDEREAKISVFDHGLLYGITTAMMAIMTGWFAAVVFRRD